MSCFSSKFDLFDYMSGISGWRDKDDNKVNDTYFNPRHENEWEDFLVFKERTKGMLHQHLKVVVSEYNQEDIKERCSQFDFTEHIKVIKDKRFKTGVREEKYFTYTYWNKEYSSLKELNKKGVYITIDIKFDTLLDLLPYYPYIVSSSASTEDSLYIVISSKPYPLERRDTSLKTGGRLSDDLEYCTKKLQDHYQEVVLKYYNSTNREVIEELEFKKFNDDNYIAKTSYDIDDKFKAEWIFDNDYKVHWTAPEVLNKHSIKMSKDDAEYYLGTKMKVKYVKVNE